MFTPKRHVRLSLPSSDEGIRKTNEAYLKRMRAVTDRGGVWGAIQPYGLGQKGHV